MEILRKMLDNLHAVVLKYFGKMNIVLIGKSIAYQTLQRAVAMGWKPLQYMKRESASGSEIKIP